MTASTDVQRRGVEFYASWSPAMQNFRLVDEDLQVLMAAADHLIPGEDGWPTPSATDVRAYIERGARRKADVDFLTLVASRLRKAVGDADALQSGLTALQNEQPVAFRVLLEFVYYAYYAQQDVARAIRHILDCDYITPPQPRGYVMPPDRIAPSQNHSYTPTHLVRRVDLRNVDFTEK